MQGFTNRSFHPRRAKVFTFPQPLFHGYEIDKAFKLCLSTDWNADRNRSCTCTVFNHVNAVKEVRADLVHFVNEHDAWNFIPICLTPNCLCLWLNTGVTVKNSNSAVENSQRTLNFNCEVNVARCVDDVHAVLFRIGCCAVFCALPERRRRSGCNGNSALLLLFHVVHRCGTIMHLTDVVLFSSVEKNALGTGCFTCIDVRDDTKVAVSFEGIFACHLAKPFLLPTVMAEGFVRLGHLVRVFALLNGGTTSVHGVKKFASKTLFHCVFVA